MGDGDRHARFSLSSGRRRALGVAFGVNGSLDAAVGGPQDVSVGLELNHWNGAVEPRVVLGELYPIDAAPAAAERPAEPIADDEFWRAPRRRARARAHGLAARRRQRPDSSAVVIDRRNGSGVATIAALASSGETVLAVCADAMRRRELVERAARPARFGGGELAIVSARLGDAVGRRRRDAGSRRRARGSCSPIGRRWRATRASRGGSRTW